MTAPAPHDVEHASPEVDADERALRRVPVTHANVQYPLAALLRYQQNRTRRRQKASRPRRAAQIEGAQ